ncbi:receptor-like protein 9a isoform X5 [Citrus sinensis]|uniref:receptor-like protein 9a isoform X5 n=1 Tax=Citrus sinensis TaxID=2711 RepID=UPI002278FAC6|nr:receptor-like protein 9a isoform X5 [Citrus sinensis]
METSFVRLSISVIMITVLMNEKHGFKACLETERTALLQIKSFFISASDIEYKDSILSSWVDDEDDDGMPSDCCHWQRVKCNATTGRVMQLSLKNTTRLNYPYDWFPLLNMSLFHPLEELQSLDLSVNNFSYDSKVAAYDSLRSLKQLKILVLGRNYFDDSIFSYLNTLPSLCTLILHWNRIEGSQTNQGLANLQDLRVLDLSGNFNITSGSLTRLGLANLTNLKRLHLRFCGVTTIQGEMKELSLLDLSRNYFSGGLSQSVVTGCFSLELLDLSNNNFEGQFFSEYMNLTRLRHLYFENNNFSGKIKDGLLSSTSLQVLDISNNILSGHIPHWMGNFSSELEILSMSKNHLEGNVPVQLNNLERLRILDISENRLSGPMASSLNLSSVEHLSLQKNALNGLIPGELFRSCKLVTLNLRDNTFSGRIPHQINEHSNLRFLLLGGNHLQGPIPDQLCQLQKLAMMDLSRNKFSGSIPPCFANVLSWRVGSDDVLNGSKLNSPELDEEIEFGSLGNNRSSNTMFGMWRWLSALEKRAAIDERVEIEFAMKNRYEIYNGSNVNRVTGLDLSCNQLTGEIPSDIGQLQAILALNLSNNSLSGSIPESFSNLKMIESLDISYNKLTGQIPPQLTALNFLSIFNVSYNNLSGRTPDKGQFATFDESSYRGNPSLCAWLIQQKYSRTLKPTTTQASGAEEEEEEEDDDESAIDMVTLYSSFGASYVTVILVLIAILWINSYWRRLWFYSIDRCINTWYYWLSKYVLCR